MRSTVAAALPRSNPSGATSGPSPGPLAPGSAILTLVSSEYAFRTLGEYDLLTRLPLLHRLLLEPLTEQVGDVDYLSTGS